jgi:pilus assembly protein CpaF
MFSFNPQPQPTSPPRSNVLNFIDSPEIVLSDDDRITIENAALAAVNLALGSAITNADIDNPNPQLRVQVEAATREAITAARNARKIGYSAQLDAQLLRGVVDKLLGYGWLESLLPPARAVNEIMLNPDGTTWVVPRGSSQPQAVPDCKMTPTDAMLIIGKILAKSNRRATEAEPEVSAKLPRSIRFPTGARVHVVIPPISNGDYPALNIRFYETEPVRPETLLAWGALSKDLFDFLVAQVQAHKRIMIAGGTGTGKTTLLSAIANAIPPEERVLLVEDPSEIVMAHPQIVSLEARPPSLEGKYGVTMSELVNAAMRMTPKWLMVGEVRTGGAAAALFSAQMSDHPGLSTIHADSPRAAIRRLTLLIHTDTATAQISQGAIKELVVEGLDLLVQIQNVHGVRRVTRVIEIEPDLTKSGDIGMRDLWVFDSAQTTWQQVGEPLRSR